MFHLLLDLQKKHKVLDVGCGCLRCGIHIIQYLEPNGYFNLRDVVLKIKKMGFSRIFLETGVNLTSNFLKDNLIDDFKLFVSSKKLGKKGDNKFKREIQLFLDKKMKYEEKINLLGDKLISYRIK